MTQYQICQIVFINTSPYGTYVANDIVKVFWDTTIADLVVTKNGTTITSGSDIPYTFIYNSLPDTSYKREGIEQTIICYGTSLVKYERISQFPYFSISLLENHASCSVGGGIVCDIYLTDLPIITNASSIGVSDGSISISAASSNGSVEYNLGSDFVYGHGQSSGVFTNLSAGSYTIYIRESINCRLTKTVTVDYDRSYGEKYKFEFITQTGETHKTLIKEKDYAGSSTDVTGSVSPVTYRMRGEGNKDKFMSVYPSEIEVRFMSESNAYFESIYTNNPDKYKIEHYISNNIVWQGRIITNQYQEAYVNPPYEISIIATDGLAMLDQIPFLDSNGNPFYGQFSQIKLLSYILKKTGISIGIRSGINIFPTAIVISSEDSLDVSYVDVSRYYLLGDVPNCLQILKWILEPYCASIKQWDNYWYITRAEEQIDTFNYREFDSNGIYVTNSTYNPIIDVKNSTSSDRMMWNDRNQVLRIMPGFGTGKLIYDLGLKNNILLNGDFRLTSKLNYDLAIGDNSVQVVPDLSNWQIINGEAGTSVTVGYEQLDGLNIAVSFKSNSNYALNSLLSQTYFLKTGNTDAIKLSIRFKVTSDELTIFPALGFGIRYIKVKIILKYGDYFLADDGSWSSTTTYITYYVSEDKINQYIEYEISTNQPIPDYISGADLYVQIFFPHINDVRNTGLTTADAITNLRNLDTVGAPKGYRTEVDDITGIYHPINAGLGYRCILYYELTEDNNSESLPDLVQPSDYATTTNEVKWQLVDYRNYQSNISNTIVIDYIKVSILYDSKELPENAYSEASMELFNNEILNKTIVHGTSVDVGTTIINKPQESNSYLDLSPIYNSNPFPFYGMGVKQWFQFVGLIGIVDFIATSAELVYTGYIRSSVGSPYNSWYKDGLTQAKTLQQLILDSYTAQYNQPWRLLTGNMYSDDKMFYPINSLRETMDNNRLYIPTSLEIDFYNNTYSTELMELLDYTVNDGSGFSLGFTIGFKA